MTPRFAIGRRPARLAPPPARHGPSSFRSCALPDRLRRFPARRHIAEPTRGRPDCRMIGPTRPSVTRRKSSSLRPAKTFAICFAAMSKLERLRQPTFRDISSAAKPARRKKSSMVAMSKTGSLRLHGGVSYRSPQVPFRSGDGRAQGAAGNPWFCDGGLERRRGHWKGHRADCAAFGPAAASRDQ